MQYAQKGYAIGHVYTCMYIYMYVTKIARFGIFRIKQSLEKCSWCFPFTLRRSECDGWWPRSSAISVSLLALVRPLGVVGPVMHTCAHWLVGVLLHLPQCWLDKTPATNHSVLLVSAVCCWHLQCSKHFTDMQCSARTGYIMCSVEL